MQIPQEILKAWEKLVKKQGITVVAQGSRVSYRTIKGALASGQMAKKPYEKMNRYLIKEAGKTEKVMAAIEDDNN